MDLDYVVPHDRDVKKTLKKCYKHVMSGVPPKLVCLAIGHGATKTMDEAVDWIHDYRKHEKTYPAKMHGIPTLQSLTASILLLVDPLPHLSDDTREEYNQRQALRKAGVLIIEREEDKTDERHFLDSIAAIQSVAPMPSVENPAAYASIPEEALHAKPKKLSKRARPYGRRPIHAELPAKKALQKMFDDYLKAD